MTHICVGNLTIIGPDNGLSPGRRQAIIWNNAGILLIGPWGTNFSEILIGIHTFSFKKIQLKMSSAKWRPFCLGLNVLNKACTCVFCYKPMPVGVRSVLFCLIFAIKGLHTNKTGLNKDSIMIKVTITYAYASFEISYTTDINNSVG